MIHFKGAGFRCQKRGDQVYRTYFMGSHNFHQRSGFSDKEHMINWNESTDGDCSTPSHDLISYRNEYYGKTAGERARYIKTYYNPKYPEFSSLYFELLEVTRNHNDEKHSTIARGLIRTFYSVTNQGMTVNYRHPQKMETFVEKLEEGGLKDLIGFLF